MACFLKTKFPACADLALVHSTSPGGASGRTSSSMSGGVAGQPPSGSMGSQLKRQPMMGKAPMMGQAPADDFGDFGSFSGASQPQPQQHAALSQPFPAPLAAPRQDSGFDSLI